MIYQNKVKADRKATYKKITSHPYFGFIIVTVIMLLIQLLLILGVGFTTAFIDGFAETMIYVIVALGFSILLGYAGLASLGTAGFVGVGTYLLGFFTKQLDVSIIWVVIISVLGAIVIGTVVGFISLRIEGMYLAIITLGLSEILVEVFKNATTITNGTNGLLISDLVIFGTTIEVGTNLIFISIALIMLLIMIITFNLMKSPTGRGMLAMRNSQSAAQAMGVSIFKYRLLAFIVSTVYAILGGVLYMSYKGFTIPTSWSLGFSLNVLAAVIVGGSQSIYGIILGTFLIFGLDLTVFSSIDFLTNNSYLITLFNGLLIILVIMFYPGGLIRLVNLLIYKIKQAFKKLRLKRKEYKYGADSE